MTLRLTPSPVIFPAFLFLTFRKPHPGPGLVFTVGKSRLAHWKYLVLTVARISFQVAHQRERETGNRSLGRLGGPALAHRAQRWPVKAEVSFHSSHGHRLLSVSGFRPGESGPRECGDLACCGVLTHWASARGL